MENSRNIWCGNYKKCLDEAVRHNKQGFSCAGCEKEYVFEEVLYENEKIIVQDKLNPNCGLYRLLYAAYKAKYDSDYRKGPNQRIDAFAEYAYEVLPENISEKAIPSETALKTLDIAKEAKKYPRAPDETHVNSLGSAFINPNWRHCGEAHLAEDLNQSKSWIQKGEAEGWLASDKYLGFKWYAQNSTDYIKQLIETGQLKNYRKSFTDCTGSP
jgi:hypothetical protein